MNPQANGPQKKTYSMPDDLADPYQKDKLEAYYIEKY